VRLLSILGVHVIKCAKVRALFAENKVRFARAEQLWSLLTFKQRLKLQLFRRYNPGL